MPWAMSRIKAFSSFTTGSERFIGIQKNHPIAPRVSSNVAHLEGLFSENIESYHDSLRSGDWGVEAREGDSYLLPD